MCLGLPFHHFSWRPLNLYNCRTNCVRRLSSFAELPSSGVEPFSGPSRSFLSCMFLVCCCISQRQLTLICKQSILCLKVLLVLRTTRSRISTTLTHCDRVRSTFLHQTHHSSRCRRLVHQRLTRGPSLIPVLFHCCLYPTT